MINFSNYFNSTKVEFSKCDRPKSIQSYVSYSSRANQYYITIESLDSLQMYIDYIDDWGYIYFKDKYRELLQDLFKIEFCWNWRPPEARIVDDETISIDGYAISSLYWYGSDENGDFVIRCSDHWCDVASCFWSMDSYNSGRVQSTGKAYLKDFEIFEPYDHDEDNDSSFEYSDDSQVEML